MSKRYLTTPCIWGGGNSLEQQNTNENFMEYAHTRLDGMGVFFMS